MTHYVCSYSACLRLCLIPSFRNYGKRRSDLWWYFLGSILSYLSFHQSTGEFEVQIANQQFLVFLLSHRLQPYIGCIIKQIYMMLSSVSNALQRAHRLQKGIMIQMFACPPCETFSVMYCIYKVCIWYVQVFLLAYHHAASINTQDFL